jgi:putative hydrolase of the HAD superfamily
MLINENQIKVIGFDADDTLWVNEPYYQETESIFCELLANYGSAEEVSAKLLDTEHRNLPSYGYGTKGFMLSMLETALSISEGQVSTETLGRIISLGKAQLQRPVELLDGVIDTLKKISQLDVPLIVATKGDLKDQERKLEASRLAPYFHHVEIMSDKQPANYQKLLDRLNIQPEQFLMVGNSLKSDVLPVLMIGAQAVHIPYHTTWAHEEVDPKSHAAAIRTIKSLEDLVALLGS